MAMWRMWEYNIGCYSPQRDVADVGIPHGMLPATFDVESHIK